MLAFKTLRDGARPPDNLSEVRAATVAQLQLLVYDSKAFEDQVRRASDNLSILRSARERRDTARQDESTAAGQYHDVEKLLVDAVEHLARLRRAAPAASNQEAIEALTNKFVLRLPFPRPGQWIRSTVPQHTTYTTDEGIETRSVTEYLPHADPTQTVVVKRTYYAAADAGRLGSAVTPHPLLTQCQRHQEALSIVRELTHADDDEWRDRVTERTELRETSHDDRWSAFSRAAQVSKEVRRIAAPTSLGAAHCSTNLFGRRERCRATQVLVTFAPLAFQPSNRRRRRHNHHHHSLVYHPPRGHLAAASAPGEADGGSRWDRSDRDKSERQAGAKPQRQAHG